MRAKWRVWHNFVYNIFFLNKFLFKTGKISFANGNYYFNLFLFCFVLFIAAILFDCDLVSVNNRQFINPKRFIQKFSKNVCFS